jgi:hypothetical protein
MNTYYSSASEHTLPTEKTKISLFPTITFVILLAIHLKYLWIINWSILTWVSHANLSITKWMRYTIRKTQRDLAINWDRQKSNILNMLQKSMMDTGLARQSRVAFLVTFERWKIDTLFAWLISHQSAVLFSQNAISQQYFSLRTNQHQPSATNQTNRLRDPPLRSVWCDYHSWNAYSVFYGTQYHQR